MHPCQMQHNFRCSVEYLNSDMQVYRIFWTKLLTFDILHDFLLLTIAKINSEVESVYFGPPCILVEKAYNT